MDLPRGSPRPVPDHRGAIVIAADELDPVIARVVSLVPETQGTVVRLEILPGDPLDYADAPARARLRSA